ncbi:fatty-acyl-CoA synthase [Actinomycetospora corticicola]|uniref:Fatty-acyl-CoA synthase n=1 Tax=Actinomycetospora corticicola TaxID=663602 RepID=A0A7Y9DWS1_9PSEU|nr:fatty-acyl-CoA synthase [Actinomycetospora corticicola]
MTSQTWITELTPLSFLQRSASVYPDKTAIVHGASHWTYAEFARDAQRLARGLRASGVQPGDRVACLLPNVPAMLHAHFGVPLAGAILVAVNTRLSAEEVRYILDHSGATVLVVDSTLLGAVDPIRESLETVREIVVHTDPEGPDAGSSDDGYAGLLARGDEGSDGGDLSWEIDDERSTITINYTSGTTGKPKGVQYHHRGAYLNSFGEIVHSYHDPSSVYLWTLPMFHCNGWCTPWAITAIGGTHVCLREVRGDAIWALIGEHRVTHLNGAPTVVTTIMNAAEARQLDYQLVVTTAGAPPSPTTILEMERLGFRVVHVYGLTEVYGPYTVCQWQDDWASLEPTERARLQARQGVAMVQADPVRVVETLDEDVPDWASVQLVDVPADGTTMGEIVMRGNNVMSGYYRDDEATAKAFAGGWYHSGDLGVMHPDGYVELRDRAKDVIISGGENISTVEVEQAVLSHPAVLEAAVVGVPDERWGERPKAFITLRQGQSVEPDDVVEHVKTQIARYKAPREVEVIDELPKTSTGKIQKFELRAKEWGGRERKI